MKDELDEYWEELVKENLKRHKGIEDLSKEAKEVLRDTIPKIESEGLGEVNLNNEYLKHLFGNKAKDINIPKLANELGNVNFKVADTKNEVSSLRWVFTETGISNEGDYTLYYAEEIVKNKLLQAMIFKNIDHELSEEDFDKLYEQENSKQKNEVTIEPELLYEIFKEEIK